MEASLNKTSIAILNEKFLGMDEKLDKVITILEDKDGPDK